MSKLNFAVFLSGLLLTLGAVGTFDVDPDADVLVQGFLAFAGIGIMFTSLSNLPNKGKE